MNGLSKAWYRAKVIYYNRFVFCFTHMGLVMTGKYWIKTAIAECLVLFGYWVYIGHYLVNTTPPLPQGPAWLHFVLFPFALAGWDWTVEKVESLFFEPGYSMVGGCFFLKKLIKLGIVLYFSTYLGIYGIFVLYISMQVIYHNWAKSADNQEVGKAQ